MDQKAKKNSGSGHLSRDLAPFFEVVQGPRGGGIGFVDLGSVKPVRLVQRLLWDFYQPCYWVFVSSYVVYNMQSTPYRKFQGSISTVGLCSGEISAAVS